MRLLHFAWRAWGHRSHAEQATALAKLELFRDAIVLG